MANIYILLTKIATAIYGEEVRGALHDSIEAVNEDVEGAKTNIDSINSKIETITNNVNGTSEALKAHVEAEVLDHPDGSVTMEKLSDGVVVWQKLDNTMKDIINDKVSQNAFTSAVNDEAATREAADTELQGRADALEAVVPTQATASNQLADKNFVNSSVQTLTATFRGNYDTYIDLISATPPEGGYHNNDYAVVIDASGDGHSGTWRYKWDGAQWIAEYQINGTPLTAAQLTALNSGITVEAVTAIRYNTDAIEALSETVTNNINDIDAVNTELSSHKNAMVLDHPDGSVGLAKLSADLQAYLSTLSGWSRSLIGGNASTMHTRVQVDGGMADSIYNFYEIIDGGMV